MEMKLFIKRQHISTTKSRLNADSDTLLKAELSCVSPLQLVRTCARYYQEQKKSEETSKKEREINLRHIASTIAREVEFFWSNIEQVYIYFSYLCDDIFTSVNQMSLFSFRLWKLNFSLKFTRRGSKLSAYKRPRAKVCPIYKLPEI